MTEQTRRQFVRLAGVTALGAVGASPTATAQTDADGEWVAADSPTNEPLNGVVNTVEGPFAVGGGGDVIGRTDSGWEKFVEYGPQARSRPLTGVDVTDDGEAVWFVGGSGVIGEYNVATKTLTNYSAPNGMTSTWEDCAVRGSAGEDERLYFVNGSGELLVGVRQESGAVQYADVLEPGGGSTIPGIDFNAREHGHVCSTSQFVAESTDGGESWEQIGIDFSGASFFDVASVGERDVNVAAGDGIIYRYDGFRWTPHVVDDGRQAIRAVDRTPDAGVAAGDGAKVYERISTGQWRQYTTPVETKFQGVVCGNDGVDVAVGNGGKIVERVREESVDDGTETETQTATETRAAVVDESNVPVSPANHLETRPIAPRSVETYREGVWVRD